MSCGSIPRKFLNWMYKMPPTAEKMKTARLVVWSQHGIYGAGKDLDGTFDLIETAEKLLKFT